VALHAKGDVKLLRNFCGMAALLKQIGFFFGRIVLTVFGAAPKPKNIGAEKPCGGDVFRLYTLDVPVYNTVGAGDAFLSGFIYGIQKELGIVEALRHSASFSQAVVSSYAGDVTELSQFKKYIDSVRVESVYTKGGARV